jgi:hypothetical protein
VELENCQ